MSYCQRWMFYSEQYFVRSNKYNAYSHYVTIDIELQK